MQIVFYSNRGNERKNNEDALIARGCVVSEVSMEHPAEFFVEDSRGLFAVIDGMGGYKGGELAARITALSLFNGFWNNVSLNEENLRDLFYDIAKRMHVEAEQNPLLSKMGATLAGLVLGEDVAVVFNCGDCRVYRFRSGYLDKISRDHSLVQEFADRGDISEEEMRTHPQKNVVTAAVQASGTNREDIVFYLNKFSCADGDAFFLCSDGVWEALPVEEIEECLGIEDMVDGCEELRRRLMGTACKDNITFVFLRF